MSPTIPFEVKARLRDLLLRIGDVSDRQARDLYLDELEEQLGGQGLNVRRYPDTTKDVFSVVDACLKKPGALGKFTRIVVSFVGSSERAGELERLVSEIERRTPLTQVERTSLIQLIDRLPRPLTDLAPAGLTKTAVAAWNRADPQEAVAYIEEASGSVGDPLLIMSFVDVLAHSSSGSIARELHCWIDAIGERLCFRQGEIRDLCLRSRDTLISHSAQVDRLPVEDVSGSATDGGLAGQAVGELEQADDPSEQPGENVLTIRGVRRAEVEPPVLTRVWSGVPFRNPHFTGREALLARLREELVARRTMSVLPQTLHGFGGVGKTQLAIEYVYRYADDYNLVWWISAERRTDVLASLAELGKRLGLPASDDMQQNAKTVVDALGVSPYDWLLVYDNADRPDDIASVVPSSGGHVILTSRNSEWTTRWSAIEVDVFDRDESIELLGKRATEIPRETADQLAEKLGDLPLALEQAVNYQIATGMPVKEYLSLLDERVRDLLGEGQPEGYGTTLAAFLGLAFDSLRQDSPAAAELLELFAFLGPEPISAGLLRNGRFASLSDALRGALSDPIGMNRIIRQLPRYGLAKVDPKGQRIQVHRLVQAVLRSELDADRKLQSQTNVRNLLGAANPSNPDDRETWSVHAELGPHIGPANLINATNADARLVALDQARYLFLLGDYGGSRALGTAMVGAWTQSPKQGGLGRDHAHTLIACRHLANALRMLGEFDEARRLDEEAFELLRSSPDFGDDHEHTVGVALGLGFDRSMANDLHGALDSDKENLKRAERVYGRDHDYTLNARSNVAASLRQLGQFQEAHDLSHAVVEECRGTVGNDDPRTLWFIVNLVFDLYGLGKFREALDEQQQGWVRYEQLEPHDRARLLAERTIAAALRKTGNHAEALRRARTNYRDFSLHFGEYHEYTLAAAMTHVNTLRAGGHLAEARSLGSETVEKYEKKFGCDHRLTLVAQTNLGIVLRLLGERRAAFAKEGNAYRGLARMLGEDHPYTLCAANNYASSLLQDHQVDAARELTKRTFEISRRVRGENHPDTLACAVNAALDQQSVAGDAGAQQRLDAVLDVLERELGREHPDTIDATRGKRADCDIEPPPT